MNKIFTLTALLFLHSVFANADYWTQKADFGGLPRADGIGCSIANKGYIGTGYVAGYTTDWWEYNPATNTWLQKASYAGAGIVEASVFTIGNKCYVVPAPSGNDFWEFDPATNIWTQKATFAGGARQAAVAWTINNKGYICSGATPSLGGSSGDLWEYDPLSNTWLQKATLTGPARHYAVGFAIGGKGYIGTGYSVVQTYSDDFWEWDAATDTWTQKANYGGAGCFEATGFSIGSYGYIGNGYTPSPTAAFWCYDPATNTWLQKASFGGGVRVEAIGFSIGNLGYLGTGWDGINFRKDFWEYNPEDSTTSIEDIASASFGFSVYPNPFTTSATVKLNSDEMSDNLVMKIFNLMGQEVYQQKINSSEFEIYRGNLSKGNYFVSILNSGKEIANKKIVVH